MVRRDGGRPVRSPPIEGVEKNKADVLQASLKEKISLEEIKKQLDEFTVESAWYTASELAPALIKHLENMKPGQSTDYLKVNDVWIISKLLDKQASQVKPLSDVQSEIEEKILVKINQKNYQDYIDSLKKKAVVKIFPSPFKLYLPFS